MASSFGFEDLDDSTPDAKVVVCVGGSESTGCAGVFSDMRMVEALGAHPASVLTQTTGQRDGSAGPDAGVSERQVLAQLHTLCGMPVRAYCVGALGSVALLRAVLGELGKTSVPVVVDPVIYASDGTPLFDTSPQGRTAYLELCRRATLVTPNRAELAWLIDAPEAQTVDALLDGARRLHALGVSAVLAKGGHLEGAGARGVDVLVAENENIPALFSGAFSESDSASENIPASFLGACSNQPNAAAVLAKSDSCLQKFPAVFSGFEKFPALFSGAPLGLPEYAFARWRQDGVRGTGGALAAAIATHLALGSTLRDAVIAARHALRRARVLARAGWAQSNSNNPARGWKMGPALPHRFLPARTQAVALGRLHVLLGDTPGDPWQRSLAEVAEAAFEGGADTLQLRDKEQASTGQKLLRVAKLCAIAQRCNKQVLINDAVDVALASEANGVHLGKEDMPLRHARRLLGATGWLGATCRNREELDQALADGADYVGVGPVFATGSKALDAKPLGIEGFARLAKHTPLPVIAIGGITPSAAGELIRAGAYGVAVLSAVAHAQDVAAAARMFADAIAKELP